MPRFMRLACALSILVNTLSTVTPAQQQHPSPGGGDAPSRLTPTVALAIVETTDEAALRTLINDYFVALAAKDAEKVFALWSAAMSPARETRRVELEKLFAANEKFEVKALEVTRLEARSGKAHGRVNLELSAIDSKTGQPAAGLGRMSRALRFVKEGGGWKIAGETSAEEELTGALLAAATEDERRALLVDEPGLSAGVLPVLLKVANRLFVESEQARALDAYRLLQSIAEQTGNRRVAAVALTGIGLVQSARNDGDAALEAFGNSARAAEDAGDRQSAARALQNAGNVHFRRGDYAAALASYQRSLQIFQAASNNLNAAQALNNIGSVYHEQMDYAQALGYFGQSLKLLVALEKRDARAESNTLSNIADIHRNGGDFAKALDYYQQSLRAAESVNYRVGTGRTLNGIAGLYLAQADAPRALEYANRSIALYEAAGEKYGLSMALYRTALVLLAQGQDESALAHAERAVALARESGNQKALAASLTLVGCVGAMRKRPADARRAFDEAIAVTEAARALVAGGEVQRQRSFEDRAEPYGAMAELLIGGNNPSEALAYAERNRARVLADVLQRGRANVTKSMTAAEQGEERRLSGEIVVLNDQVFRQSSQAKPDGARLAELKARQAKARLAYEAFQTILYAAHPELRVRRGELRQFGPDQAREVLPDERTAALEFLLAEDKTYLFVLTRKAALPALKVYTLDIGRKNLASRAENFRKALGARDLEFRRPASELYELLLKPVLKDLAGKNSLIIVPDAELWNLPFQAMMSAPDRYLVEDYAISYAPSLTVLREMAALRRRRQTPSRSESPQLLALGNPSLGGVAQGRTELATTQRVERLAPLPEAEREVETLRGLYGAERSRIYSGASATEEQVKSEAPRYAVLHLATHGVLDDANPMYSYIVLAQSGEAKHEDGLLEAWEMMNMDLKADLVVLSACETARGRISVGEGIVGMSWALFVAGVPTTVVSNWKVNSSSTTALMLEFHRQLRAGRQPASSPTKTPVTKAEALRRASLKLLKSDAYRHPFYWAAFTIVGDGGR